MYSKLFFAEPPQRIYLKFSASEGKNDFTFYFVKINSKFKIYITSGRPTQASERLWQPSRRSPSHLLAGGQTDKFQVS